MRSGIITLQSFTRALQAQKAIAAKGIEARVVRLSAQARERGCAYGVEVALVYIEAAAEILVREGIGYRAVRDRESVL